MREMNKVLAAGLVWAILAASGGTLFGLSHLMHWIAPNVPLWIGWLPALLFLTLAGCVLTLIGIEINALWKRIVEWLDSEHRSSK